MTSKKKQTTPSRRHTTTDAARRQRSAGWAWAAFAIPVVALLIVAVLGAFDGAGDGPVDVESVAPTFDLPTTDGTRVSLDGVLSEGPALLYFAMGPGCDICFYQIPEINQALADRGITLVPIMVESAQIIAAEARRLGVTTPILIDIDLAVSRSYDMIGIYGHQNTPTHSFALVDQDGQITWRLDYPDVFIPLEKLLKDLGDLI
ncbi:MAG: peroxiredoxin family protein [Acidimicrobiia bacterium]